MQQYLLISIDIAIFYFNFNNILLIIHEIFACCVMIKIYMILNLLILNVIHISAIYYISQYIGHPGIVLKSTVFPLLFLRFIYP